ncbi:hypothetical protein [Neoaquamicrobium sediminum]|uniref:hypothetical protein n=1 Tax=Neoaquamicrobium sediminum TaxID=1849104 RepID=UPI0015678323|nr:hypothetical protein [Mesorhizobium sediminum]NRC53053.1 hypothetical protein [Mesorhizobium sediminum]
MKYQLHRTLLAASVVGAALAAGNAAQAQELTLRIGDSFPVGHYIPENMTKFWMERVTELSGGEVAFDYYPANSSARRRTCCR